MAPRTVDNSAQRQLPAWIQKDPRYLTMMTDELHLTLSTFASFAAWVDPAGSLRCILGGRPLEEARGLARSTFWSHRDKLMALGYLVKEAKKSGRENVYAIPGAPGALTGRATTLQRWAPGLDGRTHLQVIHPGTQPQLWAGDIYCPPPAPAEPDGSDAPGRVAPGRPDGLRPGAGRVGQRHCAPAPNGSGFGSGSKSKNQNHGSGASKQGGERTGKLPKIEPADLADTARLLQLYELVIARGLLPQTEHSRHAFAALAEHALEYAAPHRDRRGVMAPGNPCGLFAAEFARWVRHGQQRFISQKADERARLRLREHDRGPAVRQVHAEPPPARPRLSEDADALRTLTATLKGDVARARHALRREKSWSVERCDHAQSELEAL